MKWGHKSTSGPDFGEMGEYNRPVCVETVVGPLHHEKRADNNNMSLFLIQ